MERTYPFRLGDAAPANLSVSTTFIVAALWVTLAMVLTALPLGSLQALPEAPLAWAAFGISLWVALWQMRSIRESGVNPWACAISLTALYYFYRYGLGALVFYYWDQMPWEGVPALRQRFFQQGARYYFGNASHLIMLGAAGFGLGFLLPATFASRALPSIRWPVNKANFQANVVLYTPIAAIALFLNYKLPPSLQLLGSVLGTVIYILIVCSAYWLFSSRSGPERTRWILIVLLQCGLSVPIGLLSGQVGEIVLPVVMVVFGYMLARGRLPWRVVLVASLLAMLFVFPLLTMYKAAGDNWEFNSIADRMAHANARLNAIGYRGAIELTTDRFVARMSNAAFPAVFSRYYPEVYPYEKGKTYLIELSTLIPRFAWPDKPSMSVELNRYSTRAGLRREGDRTSAVFDAVSEYHVNFGPVGVLLGCLVHAFYLKVLVLWIAEQFDVLLAGVLNIAIFITNPEFFGVGQVFVSQLKFLPVWILLLYLLSRGANQTSPATFRNVER